jgi:hypothetical protein
VEWLIAYFPIMLEVGPFGQPDCRVPPSQFFSNEVQKQTALHYNGAACDNGSS